MTGFVRAMVSHGVRLELPPGTEVIDTCGTGGDRLRSINVSTIAALVVAATGAKVCKHGGRASSSAVGAADVLEELGVVADLGPAGVERCIEEVGMGFCFAPRFHPAMRNAAPVRKELGIPTVFNYLGPLANPGRARYQVVGVSNPSMADKMVGVLAANGARRAMVVYGDDGLDELSTTGPSTVHELIRSPDGEYDRSTYRIDPAELGLPLVTIEDLRGGDASFNAAAIRRVLAGDASPHRDVAVLNAAAALTVIGSAPDFAEGVALGLRGHRRRSCRRSARVADQGLPRGVGRRSRSLRPGPVARFRHLAPAAAGTSAAVVRRGPPFEESGLEDRGAERARAGSIMHRVQRAEHARGVRTRVAREVPADLCPDISALADVEHVAGRVGEPVHAGLVGEPRGEPQLGRVRVTHQLR